MVNFNDGRWHGWNGGECPVHPLSIIEIVTTDEGSEGDDWQAGDCHWHNGTRIAAFRVIKEHREPREFWIVMNDGMAWDTEWQAEKHAAPVESQIIHVREVLE